MRTLWILIFAPIVLTACSGKTDDASTGSKKAAGTTQSVRTQTTAQNVAIDGSSLASLIQWDDSSAVVPVDDVENGPWVDEVWLTSGSAVFPEQPGVRILEHASAPTLIELKDGSLVLYANDGTKRSESGVVVAISRNGGATWKSGAVQFEQAASSANNLGSGPPGGQRGDFDAVLLDDGRIRLYYMHPGIRGPAIGSATSSDGVMFTEDSDDRFDPGIRDTILEPDVIRLANGTWRMYAGEQIPLESPDGLEFIPISGAQAGAFHSDTVRVGTMFHQLRCEGATISHYTSRNGLSWTSSSTMAGKSEHILCDPSLLRRSSVWILAYKVQQIVKR